MRIVTSSRKLIFYTVLRSFAPCLDVPLRERPVAINPLVLVSGCVSTPLTKQKAKFLLKPQALHFCVRDRDRMAGTSDPVTKGEAGGVEPVPAGTRPDK